MNSAPENVVVPSRLMFVIQLMVKPVMLMWVQFLMTTLMWMKILIIGIGQGSGETDRCFNY
jgi:hypothetical protein